MENDTCRVCGAESINIGSSLHVWHIDYACGGAIVGPISADGWQIYKDCPNKK